MVAAHDRALSVLPVRERLAAQLPLLVLMILFTSAGVVLIFAS